MNMVDLKDRIRIVIADDELNIIELIQKMLDPEKTEVIGTALNGKEAYEKVVMLEPDILITDVRMPGLSGIELIERVKTDGISTDIIIISGYREFDYLQQVLRYGVQEFLLKPVDKDELGAAILRIGEKRLKDNDHAYYVADMESNLQQSYARLREAYALRLLYGDVNQVRSEILPDDLFRFQPGNYCVACLKADCSTINDENTNTDMAYIRILLRRYSDTIVNAFSEHCYEITSSLTGNRVYFIINYQKDMDFRFFWDKPSFNLFYISDMLMTENYKYGFLHFTMGFGVPVSSIDLLPNSLRSSLSALGNRLSAQGNTIIVSDCVPEQKTGTGLLSDRETRRILTEILVSMDSAEFMRIYDQYADQYAAGSEWFQIYDLAVHILRFARDTAVMQNLASEEELPGIEAVEEKIDNCYAMDDIRELVRQYFELLVDTIREISDKRASKPIRIAIEYMSNHYAEPVSVREVADIIAYTPNYFSSAFKSQTGMTFLDYLTQLRMDAAKQLLKSTTKKIEDIALEVGYSDRRYFSKLFLQTVGIKPNEFRKFYS